VLVVKDQPIRLRMALIALNRENDVLLPASPGYAGIPQGTLVSRALQVRV
jgi:hypothetical protein